MGITPLILAGRPCAVQSMPYLGTGSLDGGAPPATSSPLGRPPSAPPRPPWRGWPGPGPAGQAARLTREPRPDRPRVDVYSAFRGRDPAQSLPRVVDDRVKKSVSAPGRARRRGGATPAARRLRRRGRPERSPVAGPWRGRASSPRTVPPAWPAAQLASAARRRRQRGRRGAWGCFSRHAGHCSRRPGLPDGVAMADPPDRRCTCPHGGCPRGFPLRLALLQPDASLWRWCTSPARTGKPAICSGR